MNLCLRDQTSNSIPVGSQSIGRLSINDLSKSEKTLCYITIMTGIQPGWGPELERILSQVKEELAKVGYPYWWDGDRVGALMVKLSADDTEYYKSVPRFQPCLELHVDIEYLWRVFLGPKAGQYEIYCYEISQDWNGGGFESLKSVNWRAAVKEAKKRTPNEGV